MTMSVVVPEATFSAMREQAISPIMQLKRTYDFIIVLLLGAGYILGRG